MSPRIIERLSARDVTPTAGIDQLALDMQHRLDGRVRDLRRLVEDTGLVLPRQANTHSAKQLARGSSLPKSHCRGATREEESNDGKARFTGRQAPANER